MLLGQFPYVNAVVGSISSCEQTHFEICRSLAVGAFLFSNFISLPHGRLSFFFHNSPGGGFLCYGPRSYSVALNLSVEVLGCNLFFTSTR